MSRWAGPVLLAIVAVAPLAAQRRPIRTDSLRALEAWTRRDSLDPLAAYEYGMALWERRQYGRADSVFRRTLTFAPEHAGAHLARAVLPFVRGERYNFDTLSKLPRDSLLELVRTSSRHSNRAFLNDPLVDLTAYRYVGVEDLVPSYRGAVLRGSMILILGGDPWWLSRTRRGVRHLIEGRPDTAFIQLDRLLNSSEVTRDGRELPDLFIWYYAHAAGRVGNFDRAAAGFRELAQRAFRREQQEPDWVLPSSRAHLLYFYGIMSDRAGNPAIARAALQEALTLELSLYQAHSRLADLAELRGDVEEALAERRRAIEVSPETGRLYLDLGISLLQADRPVAAESAFVEAAELLPYDPGAHYFLADVARRNGSTAREREALSRFLVVAPARNIDQAAEVRARLAGLP
jgi:tetratricopeptide (TPR) repeat protein